MPVGLFVESRFLYSSCKVSCVDSLANFAAFFLSPGRRSRTVLSGFPAEGISMFRFISLLFSRGYLYIFTRDIFFVTKNIISTILSPHVGTF